MQFALICRDAPGALEKRLAARDRHIETVHAMKAAGTVIDGGAILNEAGEMAGFGRFVRFPHRAALDAWLQSEIYVREGVWGDIEVLLFRRVQWKE